MTSVFLSADVGQESEKGEDDEWESQQIRKGVSGAQVRRFCHCVVLLQSYIVPGGLGSAPNWFFLRIMWIYLNNIYFFEVYSTLDD